MEAIEDSLQDFYCLSYAIGASATHPLLQGIFRGQWDRR